MKNIFSNSGIVYFIIAILHFHTVNAENLQHSINTKQYDVVIYGSTFSGIAAAINAAKFGHSVALVEEYKHIGGLMTGGLSYTDFLSYEVLGGTFRNYIQRAEQYYIDLYGLDSPQVKDTNKGIHSEPHVTAKIFHQMIEEHPNINLYISHRLENVILGSRVNNFKSIHSIRLLNLNNQSILEIEGKRFIDSTYEGDLASGAGAKYRVGRESRQEYGEIFAGKIYFENGRILLGSTGEGDKKVQGYNFRIIMTNNPENRRMIEKPDNYNRELFLPITEVLLKGKVTEIFSESSNGIFRIQKLPNQKSDMNDIKNAPVRMALLGQNYSYPEGNSVIRADIIKAHKVHNLGMIYFVQNDPSVPEELQKKAREWGLAKDEFEDNDNFPYRLYIREARRITGHYMFTEHDVRLASNSIRTVLKEDAVAIGDYAINCHGEEPQGPLYPHLTGGDFNFIPSPFQIPYGVLVPLEFENLLVSVAISASHVGFNSIRLEPTWTALGQAAGIATHLSLNYNLAYPEVDVAKLQGLLHHEGAKTCYISDIEFDSPYFKSSQFFGTRGFFHHIIDIDTVNFQPARRTFGLQYFAAHPNHDLEPDKQLETELGMHWVSKLQCEEIKLEAEALLRSRTWSRGGFLNRIYDLMRD
ncbi:MAG: FAD-dependent oxidoreductase [Bacteroidales bacterium]